MEQREKLIELLTNPNKTAECLGGWCSNECKYFDSYYCKTEMVADYLIANGVVVLPCRCVGCESFRNGLCDSEHIGAMIFRMKREETDFCSYGKRKNGVNDAEQK